MYPSNFSPLPPPSLRSPLPSFATHKEQATNKKARVTSSTVVLLLVQITATTSIPIPVPGTGRVF